MPDLTNEDLDYLCIALRKVQGPTARINRRDKIAFAYGLAAGRARAIEECALACEAELVNRPDDPPANYFDGGLRHCAATIRALNASSPPK